VEETNSDERYGPIPEQWSVRTSRKLRELCKTHGLVSDIERTMSKWLGNVFRMDQKRMDKKSCVKQMKGGRPELRWLENVENYLRELKMNIWKQKGKQRRMRI
jgi:hypothetical protein